jgi:hypothetical protein
MKYPYMGVIAPSFILVPIGIAIKKYRTIPPEIKVLFYSLVVSVALYVTSTLLATNHISNTFVIHADTIIESLFLSRFYYIISHRPVVRQWIRWLAILFPLFCCINILFLQDLYHHNTYSRPLEAIIFISLSMNYWWHTGNSEAADSWVNMPLNWIISGLLLYFSGALFLFVFSNFLAYRYSTAVNLLAWNMHATLLIIMYLLFAIGFIKYKA